MTTANDHLIHALAFDDQVRVLAAVTTATVQRAIEVHDPAPTGAAALGRLLTAAALMNAGAKGQTRLTLQLQGGGPLGLVLARSAVNGDVYGTIQHPRSIIPPRPDAKLDVGRGVGTEGSLMVVRDLGMREPYVGSVPLVSGEIGDDIAQYYLASEQIGSAVGLGVLVSPDATVLGAGGFLVQMLGGVADDQVEALETRIAAIGELSREIEAGLTPRVLIERLCGDDHRVVGESPVRYHCPHDREYYLERIKGLGAEAVDEAFGDDERIEVTCEFSRETYSFARDDFA